MHIALAITEVPASGALAYGVVTTDTSTLFPSAPMNRPPRSHVLCFSRDRVLGETRRSVLQSRYDTVLVDNLAEFTSLASGAPFDAIVLCHTLSFEECQHCLELAGCAWPEAEVVSVAAESGQDQPKFKQVVLGLAGPEALLKAVQQVLQPALLA